MHESYKIQTGTTVLFGSTGVIRMRWALPGEAPLVNVGSAKYIIAARKLGSFADFWKRIEPRGARNEHMTLRTLERIRVYLI